MREKIWFLERKVLYLQSFLRPVLAAYKGKHLIYN